jgi:hypothetical protein
MSVISAMTMATRTGKMNRSRTECRPEVSRLVTNEPQATTGDAQQQQPDSAGDVVTLCGNALSFEIDGFVEAGDETGGDRRRPLCGGGDGLRPHKILKKAGQMFDRALK